MSAPAKASPASKWWTYQRERFPLAGHGPVILAFSSSAVAFSALLRSPEPAIPLPVFLVAFLSSLVSFLHLRLADEFKDADEDALFRPYRPVPRGLVTLRELGTLWAATAALQAVMAALLAPALLLILLTTWGYLLLMTKEFFCRRWLKARPIAYMVSHMLIMPLVDFYATACDWVSASAAPPPGLAWFIALSFVNGFVIEIGRKIRAPEDEERGVETYSVLWGRTRAVAVWLAVLCLSAILAGIAAARIDALPLMVPVLCIFLLVASTIAWRFLKQPRRGSIFETLAGLWTLVMYLSLGLIPLFCRWLT